MTDLHYAIIGLSLLALYLNRHRLAGLAPQPQPTRAPTVRLADDRPSAAPLDPASLANLLHQQVQAKGTVRALERHVESMIEGESKKVNLAFQPSSNSHGTPGNDAPKS